MLPKSLIRQANRWGWLPIAIFAALLAQPCRHQPGEACLRYGSQGTRAFGLYRLANSNHTSDSTYAQNDLSVRPSMVDDSLPDRPEPVAIDRLPKR